MITIDVLGMPAPKGSARAFTRGGKAVLVPGGSAVGRERMLAWGAAVRADALEAVGPCLSGPVFVDVSLCVSIEFRMPRPAGHWSKRHGLKESAPQFPRVKPDIDKLARSTLDALTGVAWDDDARIVRLVTTKVYAEPGREGARITVEEWKQ